MNENKIYVSRNHLDAIEHIVNEEKVDVPFYLCDINDIVEKYNKWNKYLPRVKPFYAVKCNDSPMVLKVVASLDLGYDCASLNEIRRVLSLGVDPNRIIYAHTVKPPHHITFAKSVNVRLTTFDSICELHKLKELHPSCRAVIRIKCDSPTAIRPLGLKFGCDAITEAPQLLQEAKSLGIDVVGVSFHVGVGCRTPSAYYDAIFAAKHVFDVAKKLEINLELLDIGGGFPGSADDAIVEFAQYINKALDECFADTSVKIISEPGTYFVSSAFTLICSIHCIKEYGATESTPEHIFYYANDGQYGTFGKLKYIDLPELPVPLKNHPEKEKYLSTIWGPTCDGADKIVSEILLPRLKLGEWLIFREFGAYTLTWAAPFNGFELPSVYCSVDQNNWSWLSKHTLFSDDMVEFKQI